MYILNDIFKPVTQLYLRTPHLVIYHGHLLLLLNHVVIVVNYVVLKALWKIDVHLISTLVNKILYFYYYYIIIIITLVWTFNVK